MSEQAYDAPARTSATATATELSQETSPRAGRACARCEALPAPVLDHGTLYIAPPLAHTRKQMERLISRAGVPYRERFPEVLAMTLGKGQLRTLAMAFEETLSKNELRDSRSLLMRDDTMPSIPDFLHAEPLEMLIARVQSGWLLDVLREHRLISHFQPIVPVENPTTIFAHECLIRGQAQDGGLIPPSRIFELAAKTDLLFQVDRASRLQNIGAAHTHNLPGHIFMNFTPSAIYDPAYCLRSTVEAIKTAGIAPQRVVFEIVESDEVHDDRHLVAILESYRRAGFKVALDDIGSGYSSLNLLTLLRPDFIKLDMGLVRGVDTNPFKATIASKLLEAAQELGIATVAEGVETRAEWQWLREHGAQYVQGFLFPAPAAVPPPLATAWLDQ